jgi:hypothetical protein
MNNKKVHRLKIAGPNPFRLLGISSHENDYRLSWAVNRKLGMDFRKTENIKVQQNDNREKLEFSVFQFIREDQFIKINLISNRCPDGFLVSELKNIDFFLQIFGETSQEYLDNIVARVKMIDIVSAVFEIVPEKFKKAWNLPPE